MCSGMGGDDRGDGAGGGAGDESMALPCHGSLALSHFACFSFFASARLSPFSTFQLPFLPFCCLQCFLRPIFVVVSISPFFVFQAFLLIR